MEKIKIDLIANVPDDDKLNQAKVNEYLDMLTNGTVIQPIIVKKATHGYWLKDGAHRIKAHKMKGLKTIMAR